MADMADSSSNGRHMARWVQEYRQFRFIPSGRTEVDFYSSPAPSIVIERYPSCCCHAWKCRDPGRIVTINKGDAASFRAGLERTWTCPQVFTTFLFAFLMGFLTHLIPAEFIGVEESLGSSAMHQKLGVVWGGLWIAWYLVFLFALRQPFLFVSLDGTEVTRIPMKSLPQARQAALAMEAYLNSDEEGGTLAATATTDEDLAGVKTVLQPKLSLQPQPKWPVVVAFLLLGGLLANAVVVGILIMECHDRGKCQY